MRGVNVLCFSRLEAGVGELHSQDRLCYRSERWRDAGVVADCVGAVGCIQFGQGGVRVEAGIVDRAVSGDDLLGIVNIEHLIVELVGDQSVAVGETNSASGSGSRIAARAIAGGELPDDRVGGIDFDDEIVASIGKKSVAVRKATGESHGAGGSSSGERRDDGAGRTVHVRDFDDALVGLIGDQYVAVGQESVGDGSVELVGAEAGDAELAVLPNDGASLINEQDAIVGAAGFAILGAAWRDAGSSHQCEIAHALGVVGADNAAGGSIVGTVSPLPDNVACGIDFDDPVVELIGDQKIAGLVKFAGLPLEGASQQQNSHAAQ